MLCRGGQQWGAHRGTRPEGRADHPEGLRAGGRAMPACPSPFGHPKSWGVRKKPPGSGLTQLLEPRQLSLWGRAWSCRTREHPSDASRLPKQEDFQSPLKSHLELSPGIKPGLSLVRFSIFARACFSEKFFKRSGRSF